MVAGLHKIVQHHLSSHVVGQVPLVVAYSGGLDSACLLRILATLAPANQLDLLAVTVDHGLRDFHREVELTASYCQQLAVRHELVKLPLGLARRAEEQGRSLLEMARLERFQELRRLAAGANIFLAHHLDDQAETMIMRLMRGTGLQGLGAMRPVVSDLHRPLLPVTRGALEAFAAEEAVPFVEDPSNTSPRYLRNRVRQEVMPAMGAIGEGTIGSVARSADILSDQFVALATLLEEGLRPHLEECEGGLSVQLGVLGKGPLRRSQLHWLLSQLLPHPAETRQVLALEQLVATSEGSVELDLAHGLSARRQYSTLYLTREGVESEVVEAATLTESGDVHWGEWLLHGGPSVAPADVASRPPEEAWFHPEMAWPLVVRGWERGDRMQPFGMDGTRLLSDLMGEARIPRQSRERVPVVVDASGSIIWLAGVRRGNGLQVVPGEQAIRLTSVRKGSAPGPT